MAESGLPPTVVLAALYLTVSAAAFALYGLDKLAARRGARRVPEATLLTLAVLGGWPGALLAMRVFRHKTRKRSFQVVFWCAVLANCVIAAWLAASAR